MKKVFIVAPYTIDSLYNKKKRIMEELCTKYNIEFVRAEDSLSARSLNAEETAILLQQCDFAIADLSYERPSCYYEVGYLQALQKKVYLICAKNTTIHQVLGRNNVVLYSNLGDYKATIENIIMRAFNKENRLVTGDIVYV
ncbi:nucleoside 2-deoxyribosyltransferase [Hymenobacter actinosclerus]|uniref:nucleoside 2-deoxyribosyltransferase n=1 Tax=Hymenobacter actinosclerus TaxID=82805 RepID=UPI001160D5D5|nr:nucleoside 2-deoxyribosyltransferase [Hymenobacter actinosclerus]